MKKEPYEIQSENIYEYRFVSSGRNPIIKVVQIIPLDQPGYYNIGFGDLKADGEVDDLVESNNDLVKVIATIGRIIFLFLSENPGAILFFHGSTPQRTHVYNLILRRNLVQLQKIYKISGLVRRHQKNIEVGYESAETEDYLGFFIRKKH